MPKTRVGVNIHAQRVPDSGKLMDFLADTNPTTVVVLDGVGLAKDIKKLLPECMVIIREFGHEGDDSLHLQMSPEEFLKQRAHLTDGGKMPLYTTNEPGWDEKIINWHVRLMELAAKERVPLVVGNFAVGLPRGDDPVGAWGLARRMLELLDEHRDLFVLGLHEYGCGVMTSGLVGGAPDDPAHPNYIWPENWPESVQGITQFHCGRFNFLIQYCERAGIRPPRAVLTEHGMDDLSDIKHWSSGLKVTPGYLNVRGWKSLTEQWKEWWEYRHGWSAQRAYFEQLTWADKSVYQKSIVEGQCIFSWGHSSAMWEQFDIAEAWELHDLLRGYAKETALPPPVVEPPPVIVTPPTIPPVEPNDPELFKGTISITVAEKTQKELNMVLAYLHTKMQAEYHFLNLMRYSMRLEADVTIVQTLQKTIEAITQNGMDAIGH